MMMMKRLIVAEQTASGKGYRVVTIAPENVMSSTQCTDDIVTFTRKWWTQVAPFLINDDDA